LGNLPCFVLSEQRSTGQIAWWELLDDRRRLRPFDFEFKFGIASRRDSYHAANLARSRKSHGEVVRTLYGFSDLYVHIQSDPECTLAFYAGQWVRSPPTYEAICDLWRELSRRAASSSDPLFQRWVDSCLDVPVLSERQTLGLVALAECLTRLFGGESLTTVLRSIEQLRREYFSPEAIDDNWVESCLDLDGLTRPPWGLDPHPDPRLVEELRLEKRPSAVAILTLSREHRDPNAPLRQRVMAKQMQLQTKVLCRELANCVAGPLGKTAVILALTSGGKRQTTARQRYLLASVRQLQEKLRARYGLQTVAGLGREVIPGEALGQSYREASAALVLAHRQRTMTLCFDGKHLQSPSFTRRLHERTSAVVERLLQRRFDEVLAFASGLARETMSELAGDPALLRIALLEILETALEAIAHEGYLTTQRSARLSRRFELDLDPLLPADQLLTMFETLLLTLIDVLRSAGAADRNQRFETALNWLVHHLDCDAPLIETAHRAGLAQGSFRRLFKHLRGISFGQWLRDVRIDAARRALALGDEPVSVIGKRFGYDNVHTFIRAFRRVHGNTPGEFRRSNASD
jgi:AraC-like DNA-binding protein